MIINKTKGLLGNQYSKKILFKTMCEFISLVSIALLKLFNYHINWFLITISIVLAILFLYHVTLIKFKDLRLVYIKKQLKKDQIEILLEADEYEKDSLEYQNLQAQLLKSILLMTLLEQKKVIYTDEILNTSTVKLLYTLDIDDSFEYVYLVLDKSDE